MTDAEWIPADPDTALAPFQTEDLLYDAEVGPVHQPAVRRVVADRLAKAFGTKRFTADDFMVEVRAISQSAAIAGAYDTALKGYEMLAPTLGVQTKQQSSPSQHLHLHNMRSEEDAHELSPDEIREQLRHIEQIEAQHRKTEAIPEDW